MKYEYGKEYECNGVKPDLPGDVQIEWEFGGNGPMGACTVGSLFWDEMVTSFRIVDERYKPAPEQGWYDYERRFRAGMPPVGIECEYTKIGSAEQVYWRCKIIAYDKGHPVIRTEKGHYHSRPFSEYKFRPLDWDRELKREQGEKSREELIEALEKHHQEGSAIAAALLTIIECCKEQKK